MNILFKTCVVLGGMVGLSLAAINAYAEESADVLSLGAMVEDSELEKTRGMALSPEVLGSAVLEATAMNNTNVGGMTGSNALSESALGSAQGVISVVQNTGNNVVIQSATIVNLTLNN